MAGAWTRPADVREAARKKWGTWLTAFAAGQEWQPYSVPLRGPAPSEIGEQLAEVQQWAGEWQRAAVRGPFRVEYKKVGGRRIGANQIPARAWIDGYDAVWDLLGEREQIRCLQTLMDLTARQCPRLTAWIVGHPAKALRLAQDWQQLLATVQWIDERQAPGMYVRQVDVPGVDTKFIDRHRGVLTELLDRQLDPGRIDRDAPDFTGRYRFRRKPGYVRFRVGGYAGFTELTVRVDELAAPPPGTTRAFIIENEITYLAFPLPTDAIGIFGGGYAAGASAAAPGEPEPLGWLTGLDVIYWGDIDTHGFAILNRVRRHLPAARSILMDRGTLLAHRSQWVTEPAQARADLDRLDSAEWELYQDLVSGAYGPAVRLEQERISFAAITGVLDGHSTFAVHDGK